MPFNKEIVTTLMRFFMDSSLNKHGGTLIFTTHYPEFLDEYDRNDGIYIVRNRKGITVENLSNILKRNDIKKSDAYQSGFLEGTTPAYEAYMQLKKILRAYEHKVDVINVITALEIEMLIIHNEGQYERFKHSGKKPSDFCKSELRMHDAKSYDFVKEYFSNLDTPFKAIVEYRRMANIPKGEYTLVDLLRS